MNLFIKRNNLLASDICLAASLFHFIQQKEKETYSTSSGSDPLPSRWTKDSSNALSKITRKTRRFVWFPFGFFVGSAEESLSFWVLVFCKIRKFGNLSRCEWINEVLLTPEKEARIGCDFRRMREFPFALTTLSYTGGPWFTKIYGRAR